MQYRAVVFDLYGTLVDNFGVAQHAAVLAKIAAEVGAPEAEFARLWKGECVPMRFTGVFPSEADNIRWICERLGVRASEETMGAAARHWLPYFRSAICHPRPDAVATLKALRAQGYRTGMITDCTPTLQPSGTSRRWRR